MAANTPQFEFKTGFGEFMLSPLRIRSAQKFLGTNWYKVELGVGNRFHVFWIKQTQELIAAEIDVPMGFIPGWGELCSFTGSYTVLGNWSEREVQVIQEMNGQGTLRELQIQSRSYPALEDQNERERYDTR